MLYCFFFVLVNPEAEAPIAQLLFRTSDQEVNGSTPNLGNFFLGIEASHYDSVHSSLIADHCFSDGKQPVAWKENFVKYWLKKLLESLDRCTECCNITKVTLKLPRSILLRFSNLQTYTTIAIPNYFDLQKEGF